MLLWLTNTSAYHYTQHGCPTWCGNVRIPFPFGIDVNCSLNEWYSIECRNSRRSSDYSIKGTPYLTKISLEVLFISLRGGYVLVSHPVLSPNCSIINNGSSSVDLTGSPFQFSAYYNLFVAVGAGCDNQETMMLTDLLDNKKNMPIPNCTLTCNPSTNNISSCTSPLISEQYLQGYKVNLASRGNNNQSGGGGVVQTSCTYGFLYNNITYSMFQFKEFSSGFSDDYIDYWFLYNNPTYSTSNLNELSVGVQNKTITHVPVLLDWIVPKRDLNVPTPTIDDKQDYYCFASSNAVSSSNGGCKIVESWTCYCKFSSWGNPYLLDGCKVGCSEVPSLPWCNKTKIIITGVCAGTGGLLFLLIAIWWLTKVIKKRNDMKRKEKFFKRNGGSLLQQEVSSSDGAFNRAKPISSTRSEESRSLVTHFMESMEENHLLEILDPRILKEGRREEMIAVAHLARRCLNLNGKKRPTMKDVLVELEGIRMSQGGPTAHQHYEEVEYNTTDFTEAWDVASTSTGTFLDSGSGTALSFDIQPLLHTK
ncbi:putative wall-associated receptor kinase-like 11 [Camellia lanceoleosa]|uniref:Wall-associated receptor kinase-like 11 n=1 Tax=Camellia lanceoleosa TaxID=1840588 RepID=A0ACC0HDU7_9ERIC|nr:putative wall-associated receptor kinase-like 11 [Camellia lanceoleosa]